MYDEAILACLSRIEARLNSDEYEAGGAFTVGGINGLYLVRSPFNTEAEWAVLSTAGNGNGRALISGSNSALSALDLSGTVGYGLASGGMDSNVIDAIHLDIQNNGGAYPATYWQPLGRGANVYVLLFNQTVSSNGYITIAFRRKLDRAIPAPPRRQPHTHSHIESRRGARTFAEGFNAQYPGVDYQHEDIPESQDTAAIGNVENLTPAQLLLAKMRNGGR